jgi:ABC-type branched-subunit amino acid transport system ATPase component
MSGETLIQVQGLNKSFGGVQATKNVSFNINKGDILGVIGPNGSGKTTLINLMTGFVKPDSGKVTYNGKNITGWEPAKIADIGIA